VPDLRFSVEGVEPAPRGATPHLVFRLRVENASDELVHGALVRCQLRIDPGRRAYGEREQARLADVFGSPERWGETLRPLLWTHATLTLPAFEGEVHVELPVPCPVDWNAAATKIFAALESGELPLELHFGGTVFFAAPSGMLQVAPIPLDRSASTRLPVATWRELVELHYPNQALLQLRRDVFDRLHDYKVRRGMPTFEQALESLLP